jgi:hypothetical protein
MLAKLQEFGVVFGEHAAAALQKLLLFPPPRG